jgi:signal recognition particle receptor subunit beta
VVLFNYAIREITAKIVYYGPGLCGKTTNLQFIHEKLDPGARGKLLSLATDGDRTLFFDFLPIEMGTIGGYKVRFQLYTVPGQVHYNATRKLVLKGVDAVAFVADSQLSMIERNRESYENLIENLVENGYDPARVPVVIQLNKRDLPGVASVGDLVTAMGVEGLPIVEAVAYRGDGVFETLKTIVKLTLSRLRTQFDTEAPGAAPREVPPPPPPPPPSGVFSQASTAPPLAYEPPPPSPPPPAPPPPPVPVPVPAPPREPEVPSTAGMDEFDLADFAEVTTPLPSAAAAAAEKDVADLGFEEIGEIETGFGGLTQPELAPGEAARALAGEVGYPPSGPGPEAYEPETYEPAPDAEDDWRQEAGPGEVYPVGAGGAGEDAPDWARELMGQVRAVRAENRELRQALRGFLSQLDRQIDALREGRELLARQIGDDPGEDAP